MAEFQYTHEYNYLGLRSSVPVINDSTYLLVTLGDSFAEGVGAPADSTWPQILYEKLSLKNSNFKLLNAGIGGSDVFYEYYKLANHLIPEYQPSEVIISVNSSDILDIILKGGKSRFSDETRRNIAPWWEPFYGMSYLFRALVLDVLGVRWHLLKEADYQRVYEESYNQLCNCLENDYVNLAKANNFKFRIIFHPTIWEIESNDNIFKDCSEQLDEHGIENTNLFNNFKKLENPYDYYWPIDKHNNPRGYEFWANEIYQQWEFEGVSK